jgi:2-phosphosulfolactate phosphatase
MDIRIESLLEGAQRAAGAVAVIDVFRAFTTAAVALAEGAARVVMVSEVEEALTLRAAGRGQICMGEVGGKAPPGFDFGNSPYELLQARSLKGRTLIQRTGAGTQGIQAAKDSADRLFATALVTASATVRAIRAAGLERISLVAMGNRMIDRTDEDELCAMHLRNLLEGRAGDAEAVRRLIRAGSEVTHFGDPKRPHFHPQDVEIALDVDRYDFAVMVTIEDGYPVARKARP